MREMQNKVGYKGRTTGRVSLSLSLSLAAILLTFTATHVQLKKTHAVILSPELLDPPPAFSHLV